jgi:spore maturation protein CgeB
MKLVVIGLTLSSSWGNGHATTFRSLLRAMSERGHSILFLERDQPWYAQNRDLPDPDFCRLEFYQSLEQLREIAQAEIEEAAAVIVGSYVWDGIDTCQFVIDHATGVTAFYDIDTPITLAALAEDRCDYVSPEQIALFDLYLSFSGGPALEILQQTYASSHAVALYCSVDAESYFPEPTEPCWDLGYLGTYSDDRQPSLDKMLLQPALRLSAARFTVAGPQYPASIDWPANVERIEHLPPQRHRAFYNSQRFTLNITRADMRRLGFSPSVRLFEAAACGVPIISDHWDGLSELLLPGSEILLAESAAEVESILVDLPEADRQVIARRALNRVLQNHTSKHRAQELETFLTQVKSGPVQESSYEK